MEDFPCVGGAHDGLQLDAERTTASVGQPPVVYFQESPEIGLSLEQGTARVPDDGRYHVLLNGQLVFSSPSLAQALRAYQKRRGELRQEPVERNAPTPDPAELLRQETAYRNVQDILSASYAQRTRKATRKGGKGR